MRIALLFSLAMSVVAVLFAAQNAQTVQVHFLHWYFEGSLALILLMTFSVGVIAAFLFSLPGRIKCRIELTKLRQKTAGPATDKGAIESVKLQ